MIKFIDSIRRKRTKVEDLDRDRPWTCRRDSSPISLKERHVTYREFSTLPNYQL